MKQHGKKNNEALGRPMLTKKLDMSVFVRTLVYEVRTAAQSVAGTTTGFVATARAGADASVGVGAEAIAGACAGATGSAAATAGDGAPCRAGPGVGAGAGVDARSSDRSA